MPTTYDRIDLLEMRLKIAVEELEEAAGFDCYQHDRYLSPEACGKCQPCRARAALKAIDEARLP